MKGLPKSAKNLSEINAEFSHAGPSRSRTPILRPLRLLADAGGGRLDRLQRPSQHGLLQRAVRSRGGRGLRAHRLRPRLRQVAQAILLHRRGARALSARAPCRRPRAGDVPAARLRRQAHALFRAALPRRRRLGCGDFREHVAPRRHDGRQDRALPGRGRGRACPHEGVARQFAASQSRRTADCDAGEALNSPSPFGATNAIFSLRFAATMRRAGSSRRGPITERGMAEPGKAPRDDPHAPPMPQPGGIAARAQAATLAPYLQDLNPEQRLAVETLEGPVLVLAGAGTGKTRVLTTRIAHILATGRARPSDILAVTFTNKAAREMKQRVGTMVGQIVEGMPWLGTFHSIGVKILRRHAELVGLKPDFTILDVDDQVRLLKQLLTAENMDEKRWPGRVLAQVIDGWKNRGLTPDKVPPGEGATFANGRGIDLYKAYQARMKTLNAADFGDLLIEMLRLFREHPEVLRQYQERFRYVLVDEYQDTNVAQYLWLRLIGQGSKNICCVGDDDQSIYGWRGAEVDNILRFEKDFPGATVIRLERNYRSTGHILGAASHLIAHNEGRLGKTLRTEDEPGEKVGVTGAWDSEEEARTIGEEIEEIQRGGHSLNEIAILVRASFQMRELEDRFVTLGLPYRVIGGPRFYERAEIRDALAYLRLVNQPADDLAFERIVNVPKRGLGDATLKVLHEHARKHRTPLMEATRAVIATDELKARPR